MSSDSKHNTGSQEEVVWITGASSGIGQALALRLAAQGQRVLITARSADKLQEMAAQEPSLVPLPADLTDGDARETLARQLAAVTDRLDRVILCAGVCEYFDLDSPDWDMMARVMETNYQGTINAMAAALPLLEAGQGARHLVAVGSQASRVPFPRAQAYGSSKAAIAYLMATMAVDLKARNIAVTLIEPGFVETPMTAVNDFPMPFLMTVEQASRRIADKLPARPRVIRFPRRLGWILSLGVWLPALWQRRIAPAMARSSSDSSTTSARDNNS